MQDLIRRLVAKLGEDPERPGLLKTPARAAEALRFMTQGYRVDPEQVLADAVFEEPYDEMVLVKNIEFYSLCEHHILPFFGKAHVAYIPDGRLVGLSKIPRLVDVYARRLQVQERMTHQIAHALERVLRPLGVAVVVDAQHMCMMIRGVQKEDSRAVTSCVLGCFREEHEARDEFLSLVRAGDGD
ncbi:MAG: GTP cyclohydrolase I FolE [Armatimonadota bacterium]